MEEVWTVVQNYGTQSILKTGLNQPLKREVLDKLDDCEGRLSELLIDSATDESEANSHIKMIPQDDKGEVVYLSRTRRGTMRSKLVIDKINAMKMKLGSRVMPRRVGKTKVDSEISMKAGNSAKRKRDEEVMDLGQGDYQLSGTDKMLTDIAMVPPILMAGIKSTGYKSKRSDRTLTGATLEMEILSQGGESTIKDFKPSPMNHGKGSVANYRQQSSSEPGQGTDVQDRLGEAPMRRTIHPRRRTGPVNPLEETAGTSRSDTRSETTSNSREERRPSRGSLMWSRPIPSPWHIYKDELMKLDLQRASFIEDARRMLDGATLSVSRLYSITGVDWLIAASINFSSTTALRFADLEGLPSNNTMGPVNARPLQDVRLNHDEGNREERPGRFLTTRAPIGQNVKIFRQLTTPPGHVKERVYPKLVNQDGDAQRYGGLTAIKKDETIFAAYEEGQDYGSSEFRVRVHLQVFVLAGRHNVGSGRLRLTAIDIFGYRGAKADGHEPNYDCVCWHQ